MIGCAQMALVLPLLPVDPATKPGAEASLIKLETQKLARAAVTQSLVSSNAGGPSITPSVARAVSSIGDIHGTIERLNKQAIARPANAPPFPTVFRELRSACTRFGRVETIAGLFDSLEKLVSAWANGPATLEESSHASLVAVESQEQAWQSNAAAFYSTVSLNLGAYEDIVLPVLSGIHNISVGLRMSLGVIRQAVATSEEISMKDNTKESHRSIGVDKRATRGLTLHEAWCAVLGDCYTTNSCIATPSTYGRSVHTSDAVTACVIYSVESLLQGGEVLKKRAEQALSEAREAQASSSQITRKMPTPEGIGKASNGNMLLLAILRLDYVVAIGMVSVHAARDIFSTILDHFVASHLRAEDARLAAEAAKRALFRAKGRRRKALSRVIRRRRMKRPCDCHFPTILQVSGTYCRTNAAPMGRTYGIPMELNNREATGEEATLELASLDQELATRVTTRLVGLHARMVLLHSMKALCSNGDVFTRSSPGAQIQVPGILPLHVRAKLTATLTAQSLVVAKSVDWSLQALVAPGLEDQTKT